MKPLFSLILLLAFALPAHAAPPDPRAVNLRVSDMPTGFTLVSNVSRTNAQAARLEGRTVAQEQRRGRILSNDVTFNRRAVAGMTVVDSTVVLYTTPRAAHAAYLDGIKHVATDHNFRPLSMDPVGEASVAWTYSYTSKGLAGTDYVMAFERGRYLIQLITYGATGTMSGGALPALALTLDARIRQHG